MLNNIRGILNRRSDQSKSPESLLPRTSSEDNDDSTGSNEGFLCPTCFRSFPSDIALQDHYETTHLESEISGDRRGTLSCPACKMKLGTESELNSHYARHHSSPKEQEELEAMSLQVKALEEGKALLQGELKAFRLQASELSRENALVREERDSFKLKANKLTDDLANLKLDFDELKARKESIESSFQTSEDKVKKLLVEIQRRPEADDVNVLQKELVSVQKIMNDLTHQREVEKEMLQKQCNSVQETCKKLQAEKLELENAMKTFPRKEEVMSLQSKVKELTKNINDTQKQLEKVSGEKKALEDKLQKCSNYDEIKTLLSNNENALEEALRISSEKDGLIAKLNSEIKTTKESIEEMKTGRDKLFSKIQEGEGASAAMLELKEENVRLQDRFVLQQEMHVEAMNEADTKIEELRSNLKKTTSLLKESNEKYEELEKSLTQSQNQIQELLHRKEDLLKEINAQTETLNENESTFKKQIDDLSIELSNRSLSLEEKNLQIENLKNQLKKEKSSFEKTCEKLELEKQNFEKRLSELGDTLPSVQADLLDKTNKLMEAEKKLQQMGEKLKSKEKERTDKQDELNQLYLLYESATSKIEKMEKTMSDFEKDKTEFLEKISSLNEDLLKSKMKETELVDDVERMNKNQIHIQEKCLSLEEENKSLRSSITTLQNEKNSLLSEIEKERKAFGDLNDINNANLKKLKELTDSCQKEKANAEKILQDASVEKEVYLKDKMKLQKQLENLENDCAKQLSQFQETVKKLEGQLEEAEEKCAALKSSLEESNESFKRKEKEWEGKEDHHTAQVGLLTENIQTLRDDLSTEQKLKESFKQKLDEISGTKLELEAKLENALDERRGLLERCLKSETECERLQKSASEMRRKYDDCVAALQELGRENQTLQVENMKHITRKWADDSEVTNCTTCGKMFSVTIRKHHCRKCGNIFCNECSAKSATVAASKKPVRVCDNCYLDVTK